MKPALESATIEVENSHSLCKVNAYRVRLFTKLRSKQQTKKYITLEKPATHSKKDTTIISLQCGSESLKTAQNCQNVFGTLWTMVQNSNYLGQELLHRLRTNHQLEGATFAILRKH